MIVLTFTTQLKLVRIRDSPKRFQNGCCSSYPIAWGTVSLIEQSNTVATLELIEV